MSCHTMLDQEIAPEPVEGSCVSDSRPGYDYWYVLIFATYCSKNRPQAHKMFLTRTNIYPTRFNQLL